MILLKEFFHALDMTNNPVTPDRSQSQGAVFTIVAIIPDWNDFSRKGCVMKKMAPVDAEYAWIKAA
jgi:hypothetical protein